MSRRARVRMADLLNNSYFRRVSPRVFFAVGRSIETQTGEVVVSDELIPSFDGADNTTIVTVYENDGYNEGSARLTEEEICHFSQPMRPDVFCEELQKRIENKPREDNFDFIAEFDTRRAGRPVFRVDYCVGRGRGYRDSMIASLLACQYPDMGALSLHRSTNENIRSRTVRGKVYPEAFHVVSYVELNSESAAQFEHRFTLTKDNGINMNLPAMLKGLPVLNDLSYVLDLADSRLVGIQGVVDKHTCTFDFIEVAGLNVAKIINHYFKRHLAWNAEGQGIFERTQFSLTVAPMEAQLAYQATAPEDQKDRVVTRLSVTWPTDVATLVPMYPLGHEVAEYLATHLTHEQAATLDKAIKIAAERPGADEESTKKFKELGSILFPEIPQGNP